MSENDHKKIMGSSQVLKAHRRMMPPNWEGVILVAASATGFSTLAVLGKLAYASGLNLSSLLALRFLGAAAILWVWLLLRNGWQVTLAQAIKATLLGAIGFAIEATLFFSALLYADAGVVTLLLYTYPAFVTLLAWIIEGETPDRYRQIALAVALVGCLLAADISQQTVAPLGVAFGLASGIWYALYLMCGARLLKTVEPVVTSAYVSSGAAFSFVMATLVTHRLTLPHSLHSFSVVIGIAVLATAVPFVALFAGIQKIGTTRASIVSTIEPVMTVLLGLLFLGERLEGTQFLGGLMVVASVILANLGANLVEH
jgi:drug/metabolite transporter (DMT)-like permease